jgi:DsbC/DsbD-like thiol-disulfide interchange protein
MVIWPAKVPAGDIAVIVIRVRTAPAWHVYAPDPGLAPSFMPLTISLETGAGIEAIGEWSRPRTRIDPMSGVAIWAGDLEFRRLAQVRREAEAGTIELAATLGYQACDPMRCLPPAAEKLIARATIVPQNE